MSIIRPLTAATMIRTRRSFALVAMLVLLSGAAAAQPLPLDRIRLPAGFTIEVLARVPSAREMTFGANGTLLGQSTWRGSPPVCRSKIKRPAGSITPMTR